MKFVHDSETGEWVCPNCNSRYGKYNSLSKHYRRNHLNVTDNNDSTQSSKKRKEDSFQSSMNGNDDRKEDSFQSSINRNDNRKEDEPQSSKNENDDKISIIPVSKEKTGQNRTDKIDDSSLLSKKRNWTEAAEYIFVFLAIVMISKALYDLYKKGFFDSLLGRNKNKGADY